MEVLNSGPVQAKSFQTKNGECENDYKVDSLKVNPKPDGRVYRLIFISYKYFSFGSPKNNCSEMLIVIITEI